MSAVELSYINMSINPFYQTIGKNNEYIETKKTVFKNANGGPSFELCDKAFDNDILITKEIVQEESLMASKGFYVYHTLPIDSDRFSKETLKYEWYFKRNTIVS